MEGGLGLTVLYESLSFYGGFNAYSGRRVLHDGSSLRLGAGAPQVACNHPLRSATLSSLSPRTEQPWPSTPMQSTQGNYRYCWNSLGNPTVVVGIFPVAGRGLQVQSFHPLFPSRPLARSVS